MSQDATSSAIRGFAPLRVIAAFDIGSNSIKMTVGRLTADGMVNEFFAAAETTRLGAGIEATGMLDAGGIAASIEALQSMIIQARTFGATRFVGVATEATRVAANGPAFLERLRSEFGLEIDTISGEREAELAFLGLSPDLRSHGRLLIADIGGASTELVKAHEGAMLKSKSYSIGSGRFTDRFVRSDPPDPAELDQVRAAAIAAVREGDWGAPSDRLVITGGTGEFLRRLIGHDWPATSADLDTQLARMTAIPSETLATMIDASQARARVLPAGVGIAAGLADLCQPALVFGAASGIRSGLLQAAFLEERAT